jgi:hypothetical protein
MQFMFSKDMRVSLFGSTITKALKQLHEFHRHHPTAAMCLFSEVYGLAELQAVLQFAAENAPVILKPVYDNIVQ